MAKGRGRGGMHPYSSAQSVSKGGVFEVFASAVFGKGAASREAHERSYLFDGSPTGQLDGSTTYATETDKPKRDPPAGDDGLSSKEAARRLEKWGHNELPNTRKNKWEMLLESLLSPMACIIWFSIFIELGIGLRLQIQGDTGSTGPAQDFVDMTVLIVLQFFNSFVGWYEEIKAGDAVAELQKSLAPKADVKRDGVWTRLPGSEVVPGDLVSLPLGGAVPADCRLATGSRPLMIDQAALTGESLPVKFGAGSVAKMGSTVVQGEAEAIVEETGRWTFFGKTASLLNEADAGEDSNLTEQLFYILLYIVAFGLPCVLTVLSVLCERHSRDPHYSVLSNVAVVVVAIVPIANAVVCTSTLAFGSLIMSKEGAIVTRLTSIEEMAGMSMLCSDKTGTLTLNKMVMQSIITLAAEGSKLETHQFPDEAGSSSEARDVLKYATLAAKWRELPKDALDTLTINASQPRLAEFDRDYRQLDYEPFDPMVKRTSALLETTASGEKFWATKGAPPVVLKMCYNYSKIGELVEEAIDNLGERGIRSLAVAVTKDGNKQGRWYFVGMLTFLDPPRPDTKLTIERAHELGVSVKMVTGDQLKIAKETCRTLGMGTSCFGTEVLPKTAATATREQKHLIEDADAFAGVFPEHKYMIMQVLQRGGYNCGMTGDGVNDAPALKKADVGIAVQGATDAARAASDIVLTDPGLSPIITAINISRQIFQRIQIYLCYRIVASVMIATFFFVSVIIGDISEYTDCIKCECRDFELVFANGTFNPDCAPCTHGSMRLEHLMCYTIETSEGSVIVDTHKIPIVPYFLLSILQLALMIIFNDGAMVAIAWDRVPGSRFPMRWNLPMLFLRATLIGLVVAGSQIIFLVAGMAALIPEGKSEWNIFYHWFGVTDFLQASELQTLMYASLSWAGFFVLMSVRVQGPFWLMFTEESSRPDPLLLSAFIFGTGMTFLIATTCHSSTVDFWTAPLPYLGIAAAYNLIMFALVDFSKVYINKWIDGRFEGQGNPLGVERRQRIQVISESLSEADRSITVVQEQGVTPGKPHTWQQSASGASIIFDHARTPTPPPTFGGSLQQAQPAATL